MRRQAGLLVLALVGRIASLTSAKFRTRLLGAVTSGSADVVVDLPRVEYFELRAARLDERLSAEIESIGPIQTTSSRWGWQAAVAGGASRRKTSCELAPARSVFRQGATSTETTAGPERDRPVPRWLNSGSLP